MAARTWFITGASRGFGRVWAEAALAQGDRVAACARDAASVTALHAAYGDAVLPLRLDVTDRAGVFAAVEAARTHFGTIDVVVNNAGYGLFGMIEEVDEAAARAQFETNFFGALWVIQAVLPVLREQRSGHILSVSSIGGIAAYPFVGICNASKFALEAVNEALAAEVAEFGIKVTLIEPGPFATDWGGSSAKRAKPIDAYDAARGRRPTGTEQGDPAATADAIFAVLDAPEPPLRLFLGPLPLKLARQRYAERMATWEKWAEVADAAHGRTN